MTYAEWLREYRLKQIRLLKNNERIFGSHLRNLRGKISIPESIDLSFTSHLRASLNEYATDYGESLKDQVHKSAALKIAGAALLSVPFIVMLKKEHITTVLEKGPLGKIPGKIVESAFANVLPSGMTLSERIWDLRYEQDIITLLRGSINAGFSTEQIAKQLDGFILPDRNVITMTPYGRSLNFDSMRLARTEVMTAARSADFQMMRETPWVTGLRWDGSGGCEEICQPLDGEVYTSESELPDTHPQCNCPVIPEVMSMDEWGDALSNYAEGNNEYGIGDWLAE